MSTDSFIKRLETLAVSTEHLAAPGFATFKSFSFRIILFALFYFYCIKLAIVKLLTWLLYVWKPGCECGLSFEWSERLAVVYDVAEGEGNIRSVWMKSEGADGLEGSRWTTHPWLVWQSMLGSLMTPSSLTVSTHTHQDGNRGHTG